MNHDHAIDDSREFKQFIRGEVNKRFKELRNQENFSFASESQKSNGTPYAKSHHYKDLKS